MARGPTEGGDALILLRRLWADWLRPHRLPVAGIVAATAVVAGASTLYPAIINWIFDGLTRRDGQVLLVAPLLVIAATSLKGAAAFGQVVLTNRVVTRVEANMQGALYAHLIDADLAQLQQESSASLTQRFTGDVAIIRDTVTRLVTVVARDTAMLIGVLGWMLWKDPWLTLIVAVVAPLFAIPVAQIGRRLRRVARDTQGQLGAMSGQVLESLAGARVAKTFSLEPYLKAKASARFDDIRGLKMKAANQRGRLEPMLEAGAGVALAGVLAVIGWRIVNGASSVGDFIAFVTALLLASQPLRSLGSLNAIVQEALASLQRLNAVLDEPPAIRDRAGAKPLVVAGAEIRFADVSFSYAGEGSALRGIDLVVEAGRTTALVGRSGAGKSTLLSLVPRLHDVTGGALTVDGQDIRDVTLASLRRAVAVVSQDVTLFDDTVAANIGFGRRDASRAEIEAAAQAAAAHDFISALPNGYETGVGERGARLSGGERQRIALARAILKDAPILLLDEATSALDAESETAVQAALARLIAGRTTLVIAHRLSTIRDAHRIVVMEDGRVVETGTHETLLAGGGAYARLHALQFRTAA